MLKTYLLYAMILHRAVPNLLFWGSPLALQAPHLLGVPPQEATSYEGTSAGLILKHTA